MPQATFFASAACHAGRDQAAFVILNESTDLGVLSIRRLSVRSLNPNSLTPGTWQICTTTNQEAGEDVPVVKADSSASDLDSAILVKRLPMVTAGPIYHSRQVTPFGVTTVGMRATGSGVSKPGARQDTDSMFDGGFSVSATQPITLQEGEGIALVPGDPVNMPFGAAWDAQLTIRRGSDTFYFYCALFPHASRASFGIFNGAGSGEVIEILSLSLTYTGAVTLATALVDAPLVRIARVFGSRGGVDVPVVSMDTGYTLPDGLTVRKSVEWDPIDVNLFLATNQQGVSAPDLGYPGANDAIVRRIGVVRQVMPAMYNVMTPGVANAGAFTSEFQSSSNLGWDMSGSIPDIQGFRAAPSAGVAVIINNPTPYSVYWVEAEIFYRPSLNLVGVSAYSVSS